MRVLSINSDAELFDILDDSGRVFWKGMDAETALGAINTLGTLYRVVPTTGLDYNEKE